MFEYKTDTVVDDYIPPTGYRLKSRNNRHRIALVLSTASEQQELVYGFNIDVVAYVFDNKVCAKLNTWEAHGHEQQLQGLDVALFDDVLHRYAVIVLDDDQEYYMYDFWSRVIAAAFERGHRVYYYDFNQLGSTPTPISSFEEFAWYQANYWGNLEGRRDKAFLISGY